MVKYTVIVPAFNAVSTIQRCIESLLNQSVEREVYEVVAVDDGSTDGTGEVLRKFPVRYIWQSNRGPAAARNHGAAEASGEIILFTDSDCVASSNWLEQMVKPFGDGDVIAVKGAYKTSQRSLTARFAQVEFEERFELLRKASSIDMVDTYSAAFRKEIFHRAGGFDESFPSANNEDTELSYKLSRTGRRMIFNPDAVVFHLGHPDSIMKYARLKFWRGYWRMIVYRRYPDKMMKDSYTPQTLKLQILLLYSFLLCIVLCIWSPSVMKYPVIISLAAFMLSSLPFTALALRKDPAVCISSPFFISLRAASIGLGIIWGLIGPKRTG